MVGSAPKVLIVGIDGGTWDIAMPLVQEGKLPNLQEVIDCGASGTLRSTLPPITATAWTSFMTGIGPGKHGVFDFLPYDITRYNFSLKDGRPYNSHALQGKSLWDFLGRNKLRICAVGFPMTFPAWEINGFMLSGFPAPRVSVFPRSWSPARAEDCVVPAVNTLSQEEKGRLCFDLVEAQTEVLLDAYNQSTFDVSGVVYTSSDIAQHYFWKEMEDPASPFRDTIPEVYRCIDQALGRLRAALPDDTHIFVLSDHGFGPAYTMHFNINGYLENLGVLVRKAKPDLQAGASMSEHILQHRRPSECDCLLFESCEESTRGDQLNPFTNTLSVDLKRSQAYGFVLKPPLAGVVVNLEGRQETGIVKPGAEYENLRSQLIEEFTGLWNQETGERVVKSISRREDFYHGSHVKQMPDLILVLDDQYKPALKLSHTIFEPILDPYPFGYSGLHRIEGVLVMAGPDVKERGKLPPYDITDLFPTIVRFFGLAVPPDLDGEVIEAFGS